MVTGNREQGKKARGGHTADKTTTNKCYEAEVSSFDSFPVVVL